MSFDAAGLDEMMARLVAGDVRAIARAVSLVEDGAGEEIIAACRERLGPTSQERDMGHPVPRRVGVTGSAGAGKSTLVDQMVRVLRGRGERVGVVAIDPTSPYTGGALLGDRIRMQGFEGDTGVYIRSMASRGATGGVARAADGVMTVLAAAGFEWVILETVGVGQDEVAVGALVDVTALVLVPGMGDDVQSLKAGLMEAADVFVVNKCDLPGADKVEAEIRGMQGLNGDERVVVQTAGMTGAGVAELVGVLEGQRQERKTGLFAEDDGHLGRDERKQTGGDGIFGGGGVRLDHLGVAVRTIAGARGFWEMLGVVPGAAETVAHERVRVSMVPLGESRVELIEGTDEDSVIAKFVAKRGEGLHHVALRVDRLDERFAALQAGGIRLVSDAVKVGAGGHRYFFVHPASTGGVLVELVGE